MSRSSHFFFRNPLVWLVFLFATTVGDSNRTSGQENSPAFETALRKPFRASLSGGSLRGMLDAIRDATGVPYWLDRRVDPNQALEPVTAGPAIEHAYTNVAHAVDLAAFPIDGVILIGRAAWVDRVGAAWLSQSEQPKRPRSPPISVDWPPLTTPNEAIKQAGLDIPAVDLPHDLWPAFHVDAIEPSTLLLLIAAQFDRRLERDERGRWRSRPLPEDGTIVRRYPANSRTDAVRAAALERDPTTKWKVEQQQIIVEASVRVHRFILQTLRIEDAAAAPGKRPKNANRQRPSTDQATFRFELRNAPAGAALATLAQSAGWKLEVTPSAEPACQQRISFEGEEDATLEQWVQRIVDQVDLTATREGDTLLIDTK